jgi:hypothetical protein
VLLVSMRDWPKRAVGQDLRPISKEAKFMRDYSGVVRITKELSLLTKVSLK